MSDKSITAKLRQSHEQSQDRNHMQSNQKWIERYDSYSKKAFHLAIVACIIIILIQIAMQNDTIRHFLTSVEVLEGQLLE
ncbi:hypothetical protein ACFSTH_04465 [Paenibacillus yanchengensis]|uniref:Uncharacterized protein n=1 Tax=Paenibacillus yanchengensis TaxID=2035833 RepID=A0ABW4YJR4_9BACL